MSETKEWFSAAELAGLPGLPSAVQVVNRLAKKQNWQSRERQGRGGGREYHLTALPEPTRAHLAARIVNAHFRRAHSVSREAAEKMLVAEAVAAGVAMADEREAKQRAHDEQVARAKEEGLKLFQTLPDWKRRRAMAKASLLRRCASFVRTGGHAVARGYELFAQDLSMGRLDLTDDEREVVGDPPALHAATLFRWFREERERGVYGLVDHWGTRRGTGAIDADGRLQSVILALKIEKPLIRPAQILEFLQIKFPDLAHVCARTIDRFLVRWIAEHRPEWEMLTNPDRFKNCSKVRAGDAAEQIVRLNQLWEMDSTPADVMLKDGRHSVLGVIDIQSRRMLLLCSKTSKATMIATLVRRALLAWGVPEAIRTDNGQDYRSRHLQRVLNDLGIEHVVCMPFASEQKPFIERGLGTFSHDWLPLLPGYIGHDVAARKVIEARKSFAERTMDPDSVIRVDMTAAEFQAFCDDWTEKRYGLKAHEGLGGVSPFQKAADWTGPVRRIADERALDMLLMEGGKRVIGPKGIQMDHGLFTHPILGEFVHRDAIVLRDPEDLGRVCVYLEEAAGKRFLCWAEDCRRLGVSPKEHTAAMTALQKRSVRAAREMVADDIRRLRKEDPAEVIRAAACAAAEGIVPFPKPSVEHVTPAIDAATVAAAEADEARRPLAERIDAFNAANPVKPETQREVARIIDLDSRRGSAKAQEYKEKQERFVRFLALQARNFEGLTPEEAAWVKVYQTLPEYKAQLELHEYNTGTNP